jgi:hypothetical protein
LLPAPPGGARCVLIFTLTHLEILPSTCPQSAKSLNLLASASAPPVKAERAKPTELT